MTVKVAIIGTAGRDMKVRKCLKLNTFHEMIKIVQNTLSLWKLDTRTVILVSGGSSWCDHLAIYLFLNYDFAGLELHLPCPFLMQGSRFESRTSPGHRLNDLHRLFSRTCEMDSLTQLMKSIHDPRTRVIEYSGFMPRNVGIAYSAEHLIAFTFGMGDQPSLKSRGTSFTWKKACLRNVVSIHHSIPRK